jgi:LacI family transcriptional regulator
MFAVAAGKSNHGTRKLQRLILPVYSPIASTGIPRYKSTRVYAILLTGVTIFIGMGVGGWVKLKRVTSQEVAERAGVSRTTVSLVLNNAVDSRIPPETTRRVIDAARELGYSTKPRDSLRSLGVVFPQNDSPLACDNFISQLLKGFSEIATANRLCLVFERQPGRAMEMARAGEVGGLIFSGPPFDADALAVLKHKQFPVVLLGKLPGSPFPSISVNETQAVSSIIQNLAGAGHRRIACLAAGSPGAPSDNRLLGYRLALDAAGLPYQEELVRFGPFTPETGYLQMSELLELAEPPTVVFATSDVIALGALSQLQQAGLRVPQDIALAGFGDIPLAAYAVPPLTTARVPSEALAREAGHMLVQLMRGEQPSETQRELSAEVIFRQSTGT